MWNLVSASGDDDLAVAVAADSLGGEEPVGVQQLDQEDRRDPRWQPGTKKTIFIFWFTFAFKCALKQTVDYLASFHLS